MQIKEFKKTINDSLVQFGFQTSGSDAYKKVGDNWITINLQRSAYANMYYLNWGFLLSKLHPEIQSVPDYTLCDIRSRIGHGNQFKNTIFDLDNIDNKEIDDALDNFVLEVESKLAHEDSIRDLLNSNVGMKNLSSKKIKNHLGIKLEV